MAARRFALLADNSLSGDLPDWLGYPYVNMVIDLSGNNFTNGCQAEFLDLGACGDPEAAAASAAKDAAAAAAGAAMTDAEGNIATAEGDADGDGGLSGGAIAAIVIVVLLLAGVGAFFGYRYWQQRRGGGGGGGGISFAPSSGRFQRFEDEGGVEMGRPSNTNIYNPQLAP